MSRIKAVVVINKLTQQPRDAVTNTWNFDVGTTVNPVDLTNIRDALVTFYQAIDGDMSYAIDNATNAHQIKLYQPGVLPLTGPPIATYNFTLTPGTIAYASEVAAAVTFEAGSTLLSEEVGSTRPAARHRGRIFIGPLGSTALADDSTTHEKYIHNTFRTGVLTALQTLQSTLAGKADPIAHTVYSAKDDANRKVTHYSMNDDIDVIRSRGVKAKTRVRVAAVNVALGA